MSTWHNAMNTEHLKIQKRKGKIHSKSNFYHSVQSEPNHAFTEIISHQMHNYRWKFTNCNELQEKNKRKWKKMSLAIISKCYARRLTTLAQIQEYGITASLNNEVYRKLAVCQLRMELLLNRKSKWFEHYWWILMKCSVKFKSFKRIYSTIKFLIYKRPSRSSKWTFAAWFMLVSASDHTSLWRIWRIPLNILVREISV